MYFLSFVENVIRNPNYRGYRSGRIEVYDDETDNPYAEEEIHFLTDRVDEYLEFREKFDFEEVTEKKLDKLRSITKNKFYEPI